MGPATQAEEPPEKKQKTEVKDAAVPKAEKQPKDKEKKEKKEDKKDKEEKKEKKEKKEGKEAKGEEGNGEKKEKKEKKDKEGKEGKEPKEGKEGKEPKEAKEGKEANGDSKKEKKEKKEKAAQDEEDATPLVPKAGAPTPTPVSNGTKKNGETGGGEKEKKEKKDKSEKKEKKEGKEKKHKKEKKEGKEGKEGKEKKEKKEKKEDKEKKEKKEGGAVVKKHKLHHPMKMGKGRPPGKRPGDAAGKPGLAKKNKVAVAAPAGPKVLMKTEDDYEPVNRWWEREDGAASGARGAKKWDSFEHHGLMFAPDYEPHGVPIKYEGKSITLDPVAEELATYWSSVKGTPYETKDIFIKNFWKEFTAVLPEDTPIKEFEKVDWSPIHEHREKERVARLNRSKEEKEDAKQKMNAKKEWYSHALLNGIREKLGAVGLEPPQLFRGRGEHPKQGLLKRRTFPEACTINIAPDAPVPKVLGMPGHAWKDVVHENTVQWIASFKDGLLQDDKYVGFAATSGIKGQPDLLKYDRARRLLKVVDKVRASYEKMQESKSLQDRQKATATYFIDKLALRVGGEKDTEEEADTVGCCSLRVEHLTLEEPNTVHFDFLGKDSIRYKNSVQVTERVFGNIRDFMKGKNPDQDVFDKVFPRDLNEYFKEFMEDLTAKVFRTFNASYTLQQELAKFEVSKKDTYSQDELLKFYNNANRQVAILCNHQKAESKTHAAAMEKMKETKEGLQKQYAQLKKHLIALESTKGAKDDKLPKDPTACRKKMVEVKMKLEKHAHAMAMKEDNKTVSLGTSKTNYMDPRITVSWCKQVDLAIERVFPRTIRTKFPWAMHFKSTYRFD